MKTQNPIEKSLKEAIL